MLDFLATHFYSRHLFTVQKQKEVKKKKKKKKKTICPKKVLFEKKEQKN